MSGARPWSSCFTSRLRASYALTLLLAGCASRGSTEVLEANLRQHQDRLSASERQVSTLRHQLASARTEADQLRQELVALGKDGRQEATEPLSRVAGIQFNSMMTGGRDSDGAPGHDVITAVLAPHDKDGDLVKLGGELEIEVLDLTRTGDEQRIGHWKYPAAKARELWHSGFLASGFQFDLPVGAIPKNGEVILHGRLVTPDGRQFDTTCPVTLASAHVAVEAPRALAPPKQSRPVSQSASDGGSLKSGRSEVITASAEITNDRAGRPVEKAGYAMLDAQDQAAAPARPVPRPFEPPAPDKLPIVRPGVSPRPFPAAGGESEGSSPRPFPSGIRTSDNWTDESIPHLR